MKATAARRSQSLVRSLKLLAALPKELLAASFIDFSIISHNFHRFSSVLVHCSQVETARRPSGGAVGSYFHRFFDNFSLVRSLKLLAAPPAPPSRGALGTYFR